MRRSVAIHLGLSAFAVLALSACASDSVTGGGIVVETLSSSAPPYGVIELDVHSQGNGAQPSGTLTFSPIAGPATVFPVTCLRVSGTFAVIGTATEFWFINDGTPGGSRDSVDVPMGPGTTAPDGCPAPKKTSDSFEIVNGDVVVADDAVTTTP